MAEPSTAPHLPEPCRGSSSPASRSACGGDDGGGGGDSDTITVWTLEDVQARITKTKDIAAAFTKNTGVDVKIVPISEDQFDQLLTAAAADGKLPDVIARSASPGSRPEPQQAAEHRHGAGRWSATSGPTPSRRARST